MTNNKTRNYMARLRTLPGNISGPLKTAFGAAGIAFFGGSSLLITVIGLALQAGGLAGGVAYVFLILTLPLTAVSAWLLYGGIRTNRRIKRLKSYIRIIQDKTYIMLSELAEKTGQNMKQIREDVHFLLSNKGLPGARLDKEETCLMLTPEVIALYDAAKESQTMREEAARREEEEQKRYEELPEEEKRRVLFFRQANDILRELDMYRDRISNQDMRDKIQLLNQDLTRIFDCIQDHPEKIRQADRLMHYYIPQMTKFLEVYADMEKQPVQGSNISSTREEIEGSIDTIHSALETMYDELFQAEASDVSTDIEVMKAMLERDGLRPATAEDMN